MEAEAGSAPLALPRAARPRRPAPPAEDGAAVRRVLRGDRAAFAALVERYHGSFVRLAAALLGDAAAAEEVAQDTWMAILQGLAGFEARSSLRSWMFRILVNRALTRRGREGRSIPFSRLETGEEDGGREPFDAAGRWADPPGRWLDETPEGLVARAETRAALEAAISRLPPAQRAVLTLRDVEGVEPEEICSLLGLTAVNQRVLLHRGRARLRAELQGFFRGQRERGRLQRA
jgi:RNA polymerase sigma-70 factor (ECF subfamily)